MTMFVEIGSWVFWISLLYLRVRWFCKGGVQWWRLGCVKVVVRLCSLFSPKRIPRQLQWQWIFSACMPVWFHDTGNGTWGCIPPQCTDCDERDYRPTAISQSHSIRHWLRAIGDVRHEAAATGESHCLTVIFYEQHSWEFGLLIFWVERVFFAWIRYLLELCVFGKLATARSEHCTIVGILGWNEFFSLRGPIWAKLWETIAKGRYQYQHCW